jgi:hypothetical protein
LKSPFSKLCRPGGELPFAFLQRAAFYFLKICKYACFSMLAVFFMYNAIGSKIQANLENSMTVPG